MNYLLAVARSVIFSLWVMMLIKLILFQVRSSLVLLLNDGTETHYNVKSLLYFAGKQYLLAVGY